MEYENKNSQNSLDQLMGQWEIQQHWWKYKFIVIEIGIDHQISYIFDL